MLRIFQLRIRDLLWFMLACALCALLVRQRWHSLPILDCRREMTWIVDEADGSTKLSDIEYHVWIDDGTFGGRFALIRNAGTALTRQLDRMRTRPDSAQYIHLPKPPGQSPP